MKASELEYNEWIPPVEAAAPPTVTLIRPTSPVGEPDGDETVLERLATLEALCKAYRSREEEHFRYAAQLEARLQEIALQLSAASYEIILLTENTRIFGKHPQK